MLNPPLTDFLPRHRELTATRRAHDFGRFLAREELHEAVGKLDSRRVAFVCGSVAQVAGWFEFDGAADHPGATEVDVACFADVVELEVVDGDDGVWKRLGWDIVKLTGSKISKAQLSCGATDIPYNGLSLCH